MTNRDIEGESAVDGMTYKAMEAVLVGHFNIAPERVGTFKSRIKQLQRLGFPGGVNTGRGVKMSYTLEHLFKLVTAFELIGAGMPAERATSIVTHHWDKFAFGYASAWLNLLYEISQTELLFARLIVRSFGDIQLDPFGELVEEHSSKVIIEDRFSHFYMLRPLSDRRAYCYPVVCITDILETVVLLLREQDFGFSLFDQFLKWPLPEVDDGAWLKITDAHDRIKMMDGERAALEDLGLDPLNTGMDRYLPETTKARPIAERVTEPLRSLMIGWARDGYSVHVENDLIAAFPGDSKKVADGLLSDGLIIRIGGNLRLTLLGLRVCNLLDEQHERENAPPSSGDENVYR